MDSHLRELMHGSDPHPRGSRLNLNPQLTDLTLDSDLHARDSTIDLVPKPRDSLLDSDPHSRDILDSDSRLRELMPDSDPHPRAQVTNRQVRTQTLSCADLDL